MLGYDLLKRAKCSPQMCHIYDVLSRDRPYNKALCPYHVNERLPNSDEYIKWCRISAKTLELKVIIGEIG